jgi:hypothetical protein
MTRQRDQKNMPAGLIDFDSTHDVGEGQRRVLKNVMNVS